MLTAEEIRILPPEYDDTIHQYSFRGIPYTSATQAVEKFQNPFDTEAVAKRYAAKHGGTPEYWIEQWAAERDKSDVRGNRIHDANETALQGMMQGVFQGKPLPVLGESIREEDDWYQRPDGIYTERKLWHHGFRIAGRADKVILESVGDKPPLPAGLSPMMTQLVEASETYQKNLRQMPTAARIAHVEDYKTNKELKKISYQYKTTGNYKMMRPPLAHLMDCNWYHYCLQLSLYMFMLEYQGFKPGTMTIIYYPHKGPKEIHPVPYLRKEVTLMLSRLPR